MENLTVGFALTGSFCTFAKVVPQIEAIANAGYRILPIMSETSYQTDTRFGKAKDFINIIENITQHSVIHTIRESEPIGPKNLVDAMIVAPCTGNTISKIANGITDSCVAMAAKANLRNGNPLIIAVSTNDGLGASGKNIGLLANTKQIYLVPFGQDAPFQKPDSLVAKMDQILPTLEQALLGRQIQPLLV